LFNTFNNNYILLSCYNNNEYSKLYDFKENPNLIRNIYGTNENETYFMIPWFNNNKYYLIECCNNKISINNLLEDEHYANLIMEPEGKHFCGILYKDNYLCVSDYCNQNIRIWDLINKVIYRQIKYDAGQGFEIISWNNTYSILGAHGCLIIYNIEENKIIKKIVSDVTSHSLTGIKKIKLTNLGECLICSDSSYGIKLYGL